MGPWIFFTGTSVFLLVFGALGYAVVALLSAFYS